MSETVEAKEILRPEARERVQDALAEVSALLRKHRLVEGLVHEQLEHTPVGEHQGRGELIESGRGLENDLGGARELREESLLAGEQLKHGAAKNIRPNSRRFNEDFTSWRVAG